jgi:hypothetical protein
VEQLADAMKQRQEIRSVGPKKVSSRNRQCERDDDDRAPIDVDGSQKLDPARPEL